MTGVARFGRTRSSGSIAVRPLFTIRFYAMRLASVAMDDAASRALTLLSPSPAAIVNVFRRALTLSTPTAGTAADAAPPFLFLPRERVCAAGRLFGMGRGQVAAIT
jgi:hypothetical protein